MTVSNKAELANLSWSSAWAIPGFRKRILAISILFTAILLYYPYFFAFIQTRPGPVLNDYILAVIPAADVSPYIFGLIYATVIGGILRCAQSPYYSLLFLTCCLLLSVSRIFTIMLMPLSAPIGLIPLSDPVLVPFYGHNHITKDLFYSGHTASVFLIFLLLQKKLEKILAFAATLFVGVLLLVQHIHYFIDVLFAPAFVYMVFIIAKKIAEVSPMAKLIPLSNEQGFRKSALFKRDKVLRSRKAY